MASGGLFPAPLAVVTANRRLPNSALAEIFRSSPTASGLELRIDARSWLSAAFLSRKLASKAWSRLAPLIVTASGLELPT